MLVALALFAASCSSDADEPAVNSGDDEAAVEADPTSEPEPEPTAEPEPEPTDEPEPTPEPEPEPTAEPEPEPTAEPAPEPSGRDFAPVAGFAEDFLADTGLPGAGLIIVHRDEGVLYQQAFGDFTEDRISMVASSSKMISAGVLLRLQDDGLLDINAPVTDLVDWDVDHPELVPAQLVSNSSGLVGLGPDLFYTPYVCQWLPGETLSGCAETVLTAEGDDDDVLPPDTEFRYGGAQWQVAGGMAEAASGKSWAELIDEIYVEPCGVDTLGYLSLGQVTGEGGAGYPTSFEGDPALHVPSLNPNIEGGAHISVGDYGTLLLMQLRGGECEGGQVLSQSALDTMQTDRIISYDGNAGEDTGYGMGWWVDRETGIISDGGAWGAYPWLNLKDGYGAYWVIEDSFETTGAISDDLIALVHQAVTGEEL